MTGIPPLTDRSFKVAIKDIYDAVVTFDLGRIAETVQAELESGAEVKTILNDGLIAPLDEVGRRFSQGDLFMPEMLRAANTMKKGLEVLRPRLENAEDLSRGTVVLGTVKGDLHDIGKNLVAMMMESAGLEVHNLGVDIAPEDFVAEIQKKNAQIVCLSALLTTTMPAMKQTVDAIVESGLRDQVKIMVGGAPVTQAFADEIGADGFAADAGSASKMAKSFVN